MVARYGQPGGVLTCCLELALYKQALALQGKGCWIMEIPGRYGRTVAVELGGDV